MQKDKADKNNNPMKPDYINKSKNKENYNEQKSQNCIKNKSVNQNINNPSKEPLNGFEKIRNSLLKTNSHKLDDITRKEVKFEKNNDSKDQN